MKSRPEVAVAVSSASSSSPTTITVTVVGVGSSSPSIVAVTVTVRDPSLSPTESGDASSLTRMSSSTIRISTSVTSRPTVVEPASDTVSMPSLSSSSSGVSVKVAVPLCASARIVRVNGDTAS